MEWGVRGDAGWRVGARLMASPKGLLVSGAEVLQLLESRAVEMERRAAEEPVSFIKAEYLDGDIVLFFYFVLHPF